MEHRRAKGHDKGGGWAFPLETGGEGIGRKESI